MAVVALTNLKIGVGDDMKWIEEGADVKSSDFPDKETYDQLKADGAIGAPPAPRESDASTAELEAANEDLQQRVADLEKQLEEAKKSKGPEKPPAPPAK